MKVSVFCTVLYRSGGKDSRVKMASLQIIYLRRHIYGERNSGIYGKIPILSYHQNISRHFKIPQMHFTVIHLIIGLIWIRDKSSATCTKRMVYMVSVTINKRISEAYRELKVYFQFNKLKNNRKEMTGCSVFTLEAKTCIKS